MFWKPWRRTQTAGSCAENPELEDEDIRQALEYAAASLDDRVTELRPTAESA